MYFRFSVSAFAFMVFLQTAISNAAPVTFYFTATVSTVPASLTSEFALGELIAGSYTFESTTPPSMPVTGTSYIAAIGNFDVDIGGYALSANGAGDIAITNGSPDNYIAVSFSSGAAVGGETPVVHAIQLNDPTGTALSNEDLQVIPPNLAAFSDARFTVDFSGGSRLVGQMNTLTAVPEPSASIICSLVSLAMLGRFRRFRAGK